MTIALTNAQLVQRPLSRLDLLLCFWRAMGVRGDLPLRVRKVKIVGNKRTRPHVVEDELQVRVVMGFTHRKKLWLWQTGVYCLYPYLFILIYTMYLCSWSVIVTNMRRLDGVQRASAYTVFVWVTGITCYSSLALYLCCTPRICPVNLSAINYWLQLETTRMWRLLQYLLSVRVRKKQKGILSSRNFR